MSPSRMPSPLSLFFFFSSSRAPPNLPSFPTRRSSDLRFAKPDHGTDLPSRRGKAIKGQFRSRRSSRVRKEERSEEHTSELQSPCNLVCRLLLEKKKIEPLRVTW